MEINDITGDPAYGEIRKIVADMAGEEIGTVSEVIDTFFEVLAGVLATFGRYEHACVGVFKLETRAPRHGVTPDGEPWETPARFEIVFEPSKFYALKVEKAAGGEDVII